MNEGIFKMEQRKNATTFWSKLESSLLLKPRK